MEDLQEDVNPWVVEKLAKMKPSWLGLNAEKLVEKHHTDNVYFAVWLEMFDLLVRNKTHLSYQDLEDWDYWSSYDSGTTPRDAVNDMFEDMGMDWAVTS